MDLFCALGSFVRVADTGSFSRVARETGLSHTAITRQIAYLEQHFGVRLLHRTTRRMSLTGDGEILMGHARRMLDASSAMEQELGAHRDAPAGLVRVGCIMGAGLFLAARLPQLLQRNPELSVELVVCDHINEMVESRLDLALCDGDLVDSSFVARQIATFGYSVVAAPLYLGQHGVPKAPAELSCHTCILQGAEDRRGTWEFDGPEGPVSVRVSGQISANNEYPALVMACSGYGIACLPSTQVRDDLRAGGLIRLLPQYEPKPAMLHAVYPSRRQLARRTRTVLEFLVQQARVDHDAAAWQLPTRTLRDDTVAIAPRPLAALGESHAGVMN
ncbi:MAG TPA: LysR family transcriptional regulator [Acetobacteraceae bacterium]|jgi:DNA-binding transcriptional LysR family regulator|nr:LysR family transcriptional regulator [Acetobacteraceae bacterium]